MGTTEKKSSRAVHVPHRNVVAILVEALIDRPHPRVHVPSRRLGRLSFDNTPLYLYQVFQ